MTRLATLFRPDRPRGTTSSASSGRPPRGAPLGDSYSARGSAQANGAPLLRAAAMAALARWGKMARLPRTTRQHGSCAQASGHARCTRGRCRTALSAHRARPKLRWPGACALHTAQLPAPSRTMYASARCVARPRCRPAQRVAARGRGTRTGGGQLSRGPLRASARCTRMRLPRSQRVPAAHALTLPRALAFPAACPPAGSRHGDCRAQGATGARAAGSRRAAGRHASRRCACHHQRLRVRRPVRLPRRD